jgi:hypothetical protein
MSSKTLVLAAVAAGCVGAAGVGGFLAVRMAAGDRAEGAVAAEKLPAATPTATRAADIKPTAPVRPAAARSSSAATDPVRQDRKTPPAPPAISDAASAPSLPVTMPIDPPATVPVTTTTPPAVETTPVPEPTKPRFEELTLKEDSVIGIRLDSAISSETAKVEDKVIARVSRDVTVDDHTAIPAGSRLEGVVTTVERGGKFKNTARLGIRFTSLVLADNSRVAIQTDTVLREGSSPGNEATAKVGASAVLGAVIGGLIGGKKGAAVGAGAGAAGGGAAVAAGGRNDATFPAGAALTVKLTAPVTLLIERDER